MNFGQAGKSLIVVAMLGAVGPAALAQENPLYDELMSQGIDVGAAKPALLLKPQMPDGLDASAQRAALEAIPGREHAVARMLQKSREAPFVLAMKSQGETSDATIQQIDLYFIVYGDLDTISDETFLKEQAEEERKQQPAERAGTAQPPADAKEEAKSLTREELAARKIKLLSGDPDHEGFSHGSMEIFDKVRATGTSHSLQTRAPESVLVASRLDTRFAKDPEYPNLWQSITFDDLGRPQHGSKQPYFGSGSYTKATQLKAPKGAVLLEFHVVFREPFGWFQKTKLLSSKLPIAAKDNIRKFRRKLDEAQKKKTPTAAAGQPAAS